MRADVQRIDNGKGPKSQTTELAGHLYYGAMPIGNNPAEKRPLALQRANWLFTGLLSSEKQAEAIMSLMKFARMTGSLRLSKGRAG